MIPHTYVIFAVISAVTLLSYRQPNRGILLIGPMKMVNFSNFLNCQKMSGDVGSSQQESKNSPDHGPNSPLELQFPGHNA